MKETIDSKFRTIYIVLCMVICCFFVQILGGKEKISAGEKGKSEPFVFQESKAGEIIEGVLSYKTGQPGADNSSVQKFIDEELPLSIGGSADWYILSLSQHGNYDFEKYRKALTAYLKEKDIKGATTRLKFSLILLAAGGNKDYMEKCLADDSVGGQGIMSYVFGLHLYNNGYEGVVKAEAIIDKLFEFRHEDKGWSVTGDYGDVDVTAMVLQALAPVYVKETESSSLEEKEIIKMMVEEGVQFLSVRQLEDGDFQSFGVRNTESTAQVITALSALGIDPSKDERFIKNGKSAIDGILLYRLDDGSFSHKLEDVSNPTATVQAFYSMIAYERMLKGKSSLYVLDSKEEVGSKEALDSKEEVGSKEAFDSKEELEQADIISGPDENKLKEEFKSEDAESKENQLIDIENSIFRNDDKGDFGYKKYAVFVIMGIAAIACIIMALLKKHFKNYIFIGIVTAAAVVFVIFTDFSSVESYYSDSGRKEKVTGSVTMSIRCDIIKGKIKDSHIPEDGCILEETEFDLSDGETAYDILLDGAKRFALSVEHEGSGEMAYISGINYLYEMDYGDLSGWVYKVNGQLPSVGCAGYKLKDGDMIEWCYTLDLGNDTMK